MCTNYQVFFVSKTSSIKKKLEVLSIILKNKKLCWTFVILKDNSENGDENQMRNI